MNDAATFEPRAIASPVKLVAGLFFAALGILMTADNLDLFDANAILRFWPVIFIVIGLLKLREAHSRGIAIVSIVAGTLLLGGRLHLFRVSFFDLWPILFIVAGIVIVLKALGVAMPSITPDPAGGIWAVLTHRKIVSDGRDLNGRNLVAVMGGADIELTDSDATEPVVLDVFAMWGGIEIRVPPGWEVIGEVVPIMGGADIRNRGAGGGRRLIVRGLLLMGGMEVKEVRL